MLQRLCEVEAGPFKWITFVTLTWGVNHPDLRASWVYVDTWLKRLERLHPGISCIWRKELQERGAPHYHLLIFGLPFVRKEWVSESWTDVNAEFLTPVELARWKDKGQGLFTRIEAIQSWSKAVSYVSKYMAKAGGLDYCTYSAAEVLGEDDEVVGTVLLEDSDGLSSGRWWGVWRKKSLPVGVVREFEQEGGSWYYQLRRVCGRFWRGVYSDWGFGFSILFRDSAAFERLFWFCVLGSRPPGDRPLSRIRDVELELCGVPF